MWTPFSSFVHFWSSSEGALLDAFVSCVTTVRDALHSAPMRMRENSRQGGLKGALVRSGAGTDMRIARSGEQSY